MGTVTKALSLLTFFNHGRPEIGLSDLTRLSGMNKATVYRMMSELQNMGFVEQAGNDRAYRLGPEVLRLAALREAAVPVLSVSRRVLRDLSDLTGETVHLSLVNGTQLNSVTHAYSNRHGTQVRMEDAEVLSFHGTASGLAILSFADAAFVDQILSMPLASHTEQTMTDVSQIRDRIDQFRNLGLAESNSGFEADVHSYAAPIFGADRKAIGALAVAAPVPRMTESHQAAIRAALHDAAQDLTRRIGGFCPDTYPKTEAA